MELEYGKRSKENLSQSCWEIQGVFNMALGLGLMDISIIEAFRPKSEQNLMYKQDKSKVKWPDGKHNKAPSEAVDAAPYVGGKASFKKAHCIHLAGIVLACAKILGVDIRWGGNWDMDTEPITDQDFQDLVHYEVVNGK